MTLGRLARLRHLVARCFPERRVYLHSKGEVRALVLTSERQAMIGAGAAVLALWTVISAGSAIGGLAANLGYRSEPKPKTVAVKSRAEIPSAVAGLIKRAEQRDQALALLLASFGGGQAGAPALQAPKAGAPVQALAAIQQDQERLVASAETFARARTQRLQTALKLAGINPAQAKGRAAVAAMGGPLISIDDPRTLTAMLGVDDDFARRVQAAARNMAAMRSLQSTAATLPLSKPVENPVKSSGFGVRTDPFTHQAAFHPGQDFAGAYKQPIFATAPGLVSFTGVRTGYGNTVEIDHGRGFKTRYGHLAAIYVKPGQRVDLGEQIAAMGSTGRSTGVHLHYEVWRNGRLQDPSKFLRAGDALGATNLLQAAAAQPEAPAPLNLRKRTLLRPRATLTPPSGRRGDGRIHAQFKAG